MFAMYPSAFVLQGARNKGGNMNKKMVVATVWLGGMVVLGLGYVRANGTASQGKYVGVQKCKNCHKAEEKGNQYGKWQETKHAHAFEALASPEAKKIAQERGIADPQQSEKCLKCHVTAFGLPEEHLDKKFDPKSGVQCETCHGPGEGHAKARMAAAFQGGDPKPAEGEIIRKPTEEVCRKCHNQESPYYKEFSFREFFSKISHRRPEK
jgi:hypothetical protein